MQYLLPKTIYIETTNLCNAACIMCPHQKMTRPKGIMSNKIFSLVLNSLKNHDLTDSQIFLHKEGEPLCDPEIVSRIQRVKENTNANIGLNTNAMLMTKEVSDKILKSGLDTIYFSVDGVSAETYNRIRINCDYETVKRNIIYFLNRRQVVGSKIKVIMQMLLTEKNSAEKNLFEIQWRDYGVEFYIKPIHCYLDGGQSSFEKSRQKIQNHACKDPFRMIVVFFNGETGCCCWDYDNEYKLGNVTDSDLFELYNGEKINFMRSHQMDFDCKNIIPCNRCGRIFGNDKIVLPNGSWF